MIIEKYAWRFYEQIIIAFGYIIILQNEYLINDY